MNPYHAHIAAQLDGWLREWSDWISRCSITLRKFSAARGRWLS